jgi:hypothetical protein
MSEFVTKGKLTEAEKRREGRKTKTGRKATPRTPWGDKRPVTKSTGGKDSARRTRIERVRKYNKRNFGGANPNVTSSGDVGARAIKDRRAKLPDGGQKYKPITESDGPRGGGSKYQSRTQRVKRSYAAGTEGSRKITASDDFYPRDKGRVTRGRGKKVAGYMTDKVRGVDPPKGPSRVFEKGPHKRRGNPEGETRVTKRGHKGSVRGGSKTGQGRYSSGTANDTGARRTGGGKTPTKGAGQSKKVNKESVRKAWEIRNKLLKERAAKNKAARNAKNNIKAYKPKVTGTTTGKIVRGAISLIPKLRAVQTAIQFAELAEPQIVKAIKARHKAQDDKQKEYVRAMTSKPSLGKTTITQRKRSSLERLKDSYIQWVRTGKLPGVSKKTKRRVANLPSGYKQSEKKAFKQTKKWNKVNRKKL